VPDNPASSVLAAPPPERFTTTDPEQAHEFLRRAYTDNVMHIRGDTDGFRMRNTHHDLGPFGFSSLSHTMAVEHVAAPLGYVLVGRVQVGRIECETESRTVRAGPQEVFLVAPPDRPYTVRWDTMRLQLVRVDLSLIEAVTGEPAERVRFTDTLAHSPAAGRHLSRTISYVAETLLTDGGARTDSRVVGATGRLLAAAVLRTFPNTAPAH
jgi:hypothetical protein